MTSRAPSDSLDDQRAGQGIGVYAAPARRREYAPVTPVAVPAIGERRRTTTKPPHPAKAGIRCLEANSKRSLVEIIGTAAPIMSGLFRHRISLLLHPAL